MLNPNDTKIKTFYQLSTAVAELGLAQPQLVHIFTFFYNTCNRKDKF